jgi:hypothetical protein
MKKRLKIIKKWSKTIKRESKVIKINKSLKMNK